MNSTSLKNHIDLFFIGTAGISALSIFFLLISWAIGGTAFFQNALLGNTLLPALLALLVSGVVMMFRRSDKSTDAHNTTETLATQ